MKRKELVIIGILLTCIITIPIINVNAVAYWHVLDEKNDVVHFYDEEYQDTGDYLDSVDIVSISIDDENLILKFDDRPANNIFHEYSFDITWDNAAFGWGNSTQAIYGGIGKWNSITTHITLENGTLIYQNTTYLEIIIYKNSIICPIPGFEYFVDKVPENLYAVAMYRSNVSTLNGDRYYDIANGTVISGRLSGFSAIIGITSLFSIVLLFNYRKKK